MMKAAAKIAYFCMEYGLESSVKIYSGGLGILAGDHLKAAKDQGIPLVGIGLKWKMGYVEQRVTEKGKVMDCFSPTEYPEMQDTGILVHVNIREDKVPLKVWKLEAFGNVPLYLLDADVTGSPYHWVTRQLYGGTEEERVAQEIVLGVGGVRALEALEIEPETYHFNEGHAVLAGIALLRQEMSRGSDFYTAWKRIRKRIVFTTHTPIPAGNEFHTMERLRYMGAHQGLTIEQLAEIGGVPFNMTVAGLRLSRKANAVAALHLETTKTMWKQVKNKAKLINITNGVHGPTWMDPRFNDDALNVESVWKIHHENKVKLLEEVKRRTGAQLREDCLLIGFARRAAPYKRSNLIFSNPAIIDPLLESKRVQILFAGKAHPMDEKGKAVVRALVLKQKEFPESVLFMEDYDMEMGALLTRGCDVWLNNPQRPKEACGTSGMKAAMNGVLNVSILDGWWPEICQHGENGWAIGDELVPKNEAEQDERDAMYLYQVLTEEVIPTFEKDKARWGHMMIKSIQDSRVAYSASRMVKDYAEKLYNL